MTDPVLSIIVPIYNVDKYLGNCIESVLKQTFTDFELILIDDGSTDKSLDICNTYKEKDKRVKVISQVNGGVSSARNRGIDISTGKYIAFIDPDDDIRSEMYSVLISKMEELKVDILVSCFWINNTIEKTKTKSGVWRITNSRLNKKIISERLFSDILGCKHSHGIYSCFNKIYRKNIFDELNMRFNEKMSHGEDARFNLILLEKIESIAFVNETLYNYYIRPRQSLTRVFKEDLYEYIEKNNSFHNYLCDKYIFDKHECENVKKKGEKKYVELTMTHIVNLVNSNTNLDIKLKILNKILNHSIFRAAIIDYENEKIFNKVLKLLCIRRFILGIIIWSKVLAAKQNISKIINEKRYRVRPVK